MIIENEIQMDSVLVGDVQSSDYKLSTCSKMFDILSNHIYTDKLGAPIREILCNAWDAHVAAGTTDKHIHVTVPTRDATEFVVRDFGTGLSAEDMRELYTTYGASNKMTSNEFIGCLGLGSKSPFAYTTEFSVVSFKDGKAYTFHCMRTSSGQPQITQFPSADTAEPNGLKVSFEVKLEDINDFRDKLFKFYSTFCADIDFISDGSPVTYAKRIPLEDIYGFGVVPCDRDSRCYETSVNVIMGGVKYLYKLPYTAPASVIEAGLGRDKYRQIYEILYRGYYNFYILADIGDVSVSVSREQCEDTPSNQVYIVRKLHDFFTGIRDRFMGDLNQQKDLTNFQRAVKVAEFYKNHNFLLDGDAELGSIISFADPNKKYTLDYDERELRVVTMAKAVTGTSDRCHKATIYSPNSELRFWMPSGTAMAGFSASPSESNNILAVANGSSVFIEMPEGSSKSHFPRSVYHLIKSKKATAIMVYDPELLAYLKSQGVPTTPLADLPKPPPIERYRAPKDDKQELKEQEQKTKLEKALGACRQIYVCDCRFTSHEVFLSRNTMGYSTASAHPSFSITGVEVNAQDKLVLVLNSGSRGFVKKCSNNCIDEVAKVLLPKECCKPETGCSIRQFWFEIIVGAVRAAGYTPITISESKTKEIQILRDTGVKTLAEVVDEILKGCTLTKAQLSSIMVDDVISYYLGGLTDYPELIHGLSKDTRKQVLRLINKRDTLPKLDTPQITSAVWLKMISYFGFPGQKISHPTEGRGYYYSQEVEAAFELKDAAKVELNQSYPVIAELAGSSYHYSSRTDHYSKLRRIESYYSIDLKQYIDAMNMYNKNNRKAN